MPLNGIEYVIGNEKNSRNLPPTLLALMEDTRKKKKLLALSSKKDT